ncbi:hypothetical protein FM114_08270 [Luteococcus japonicus LSP_Lj1]|uniref:Uncharacterized protein n=1 Tax=Luteococcus japonicus LSP_Lj1 TaxID=1255658 RepID=A0A1R4JKM6_9ACTN|nr:hypothetical protein FM114_08270 [Luteococcus japonicus LSP_Lj1]
MLAAVRCHKRQLDAGRAGRPQGEATATIEELGTEDRRVDRRGCLRVH